MSTPYTIEQIEKKYGRKIILHSFESTEEYYNYLKPRWNKWNSADNSFNKGRTAEKDLENLINPYDKNRKTINKFLETMREDEIFTTGLPMPETHYAGSRPNIGAYLSGRPKNMYRRVAGENSSISTPINIYININLSGDLGETTMATKGTAIAALALALNTTRPVTVYTVKPLIDHNFGTPAIISMVKLNDNIINMDRFDFAMTNMKYHRDISWTSVAHIASEETKIPPHMHSGWPFNKNVDTKEYDDCVKAAIGCTNNDIFIPGSASYNQNLISDPIKWIKQKIQEHKTSEGSEID